MAPHIRNVVDLIMYSFVSSALTLPPVVPFKRITTIGPLEEFILINHSLPGGYLENGDVVSLKSPEFNKYVVAEDNGSCNADRGSIGDWEKFTVYFH